MLANFLKTTTRTKSTNPNFSNVTLLLHGDGTNGAQNNTFIDSSTNNFTITRTGDATQGSFSPYGSLWSNYFNGTTDYLTAPDNNAFTFDADFTVEAWIYKATSGDQTIVAHWPGLVATNCSFAFQISTSNYLKFAYGIGSSNPSITGTSAIVLLNQWNHVAVTRSGTTVRLFVNGIQDSTTATVSGALNNSTASLTVGVLNTTNGTYFDGYISNTRIVKGTALYTSNFTPSTTPLTAVTNTSLLTCQSNRFIDNSSNNFAITRNGNVSVQRFSPFNPSAAYSTSVIGGSGYFDGTGDYLSVPSNAALNPAAGLFTWECWFYPTASWDQTLTTGDQLFITEVSSGLQIGRPVTGTGNSWGLAANSVAWRLTSTTLPTLFQWNHMAVVRSGTGANQTALFLNGVRIAQGTVTDTFVQGISYVMDGTAAASTESTGYISDMRLLKGTALYDPASATYTVPTAPLTAIANTSLLLNTVNAGIFDNAMMNDIVTVGNAQVSTTVKKYGTGSIAFDGTGDYLAMPQNINFAIGTEDYTIECWAQTSNLTNAGIFQLSATPGGFATSPRGISLAYLSAVGGLTVSTQTIDSTPVVVSLSTNTWNHFALCRSGTTLRVFVDGILRKVITDSTDYSTQQYLVIGGYYSTSFLLNGYVDEFRIVKDVALYTSNFIPPTAAFPNT